MPPVCGGTILRRSAPSGTRPVYSLRQLFRIASDGFDDMAPALRRAFNGDRADDRLDLVFGRTPRTALAAVIAGGLLAGFMLETAPLASVLAEYISLPAVVIGAVYALLFRRYLFAGNRPADDDFHWLAASLIPAAAILVLIAFTGRIFGDGLEAIGGAPMWTQFGGLAIAAADSLSVAAGVTIAVAALCFSRDWRKALHDLAVRLIVFKLTVFVMVLLMVEIGIVGAIVAVFVESVFGFRFPPWLGDFVDQLTYAGLMTLIYLAVIGATWTVCRRQFARLLATGESDVLAEIAGLARPPASDAPTDDGENRPNAGTADDPR